MLCDTLDEPHGAGLDRFRASVADLVPFLGDRVDALRTWDDVRMLRVQVDRLRRWFWPGLLCIGDATNAMSPIDGVGINLAVHDVIAATNLLVRPSGTGPGLPGTSSGPAPPRLPTLVVQWGSARRPGLLPVPATLRPAGGGPPVVLRLLRCYPFLQAVPARLISLGILPEHVRGP